MEAKMKKKWIEALRVGEYDQCSGSLRLDVPEVESKFCCLGVLCDISSMGEWVHQHGTSEVKFLASTSYGSNYCYYHVPKNMDDKLGLSEVMQIKLAEMNDEDEKSFNEIADYIQENL